MALATAGLLAAGQGADAFYLPGVAPRNFFKGNRVDLKVNKIDSVKTQLPFEYYSLPVCKPSAVVDVAENLGEVLAGDRLANSAYQLNMKIEARCNVLCKMEYGKEEIALFQERIRDEYRVHWIVDNLPGAMRLVDEEDPTLVHLERGFPLGIELPDANSGTSKFFLYNHHKIIIKYHDDPASYEGSRIVGFELELYTVQHKFDSWPADFPNEKVYLDTCNQGKPIDRDSKNLPPQGINGDKETVVWTYDVQWEESSVEWSQRWDIFLNSSPDDQIHWFSIVNSLMIVFFLTGMVAMIMMRTLHRDIARYNEEQTVEEAQEESGWKLVHGDVFRPPSFSPMLLAVYTGSGLQIIMCTIVLIFVAILGVLSPANPGALMTAMLLLFVFMGSFAGYWSARLYKSFGGKKWKRSTILTATLYPGTVFVVFFIVNLFVWNQGSSGAVPFSTMLALLVLWFLISVPLAFVGSYFGFKQEEIKNPVRYNQIPRQIPEQAWYMNPFISVLVGGILPFGAIFIELFFVMSSIWNHQVYYVFGFTFIVLLILAATCAEISIVLIYFQLCSEDYHWWWRSFLTSGSSAIYLFLYSILYFVTKLDVSKVGFRARILSVLYRGDADLNTGKHTHNTVGRGCRVLFVHAHCIVHVLPAHGLARLLCRVLVCADDLRCDQGGLV